SLGGTVGGFVIGQRLLWDTQRPLPLCFPFQLVAAVVFLSFGVAAAFCCATVDGVFAARHIETRPLTTGRCQFYSSGVGYLQDVYQTEVPVSQLAFGRSTPPQILYNPAQQILAYTGFCPVPGSLPTCSSYPLPLQPSGSVPASPPTDLSLSEDAQPPSQPSSSLVLPSHAPPLYVPAHFLPGEKPPPYTP
uniref:Transmembrane protein 255B n=1 Tax=Equus asinus TaxID=9793 RepID=A0A9L0JWQ8_EQUAS